MKKFTKMLALALVLVLSLALLCGCDDNESIYGTWTCVSAETAQDTEDFLRDLEFYDEEIALIDLNSLNAVLVLRFNEDRTYEMGIDAAGCTEELGKFFDGMMEDLFNGRASLNEVYGEDLGAMDREQFNLFYAVLFGCEDYAQLRTAFTTEFVDYSSVEADNEKGTYNAAMGSIYFTMEGDDEAQAADYEVKNGKLTVTFADMVVEYTKE